MKKNTWLFVSLVIVTSLSVAQSSVTQRTPLEVVQQFWSLESQGARLTPEGWEKTAKFFEDPDPPPMSVLHFRVVSRNSKIDENKSERHPNRALVYVAFRELGEIQADLHFTPAPTRTLDGAWIKDSMARYVLVLTDRHWETDGVSTREVPGPAEWLIRAKPSDIYVSVDAAIRYVTEMQKRAKSNTVRQNAARIAGLAQPTAMMSSDSVTFPALLEGPDAAR
jgi:hypothetical protein